MKTWPELAEQEQVSPEVDEWVRGALTAGERLIQAQKAYIQELELRLLDYGDVGVR